MGRTKKAQGEMAQLIFLIIVIGGGWMLYKKFIKDAERLRARSRQEEKERQTGAIGTLEKDPVTGEYRVRNGEE
jgi:membrane protein implicated in regulation of membrane protease activity